MIIDRRPTRIPLMPPARDAHGWAWVCPPCVRVLDRYATRWGAYVSQVVHRVRRHHCRPHH